MENMQEKAATIIAAILIRNSIFAGIKKWTDN